MHDSTRQANGGITVRVPTTAAHTIARPAPGPFDSAAGTIEDDGPLQLRRILERGLRVPGLQTRNGANEAEHGSQGKMGVNPRWDSNARAPLMIMRTRRRRLVDQKQLLVEADPHLALVAKPANGQQLRVKGWECSQCE